MQHEIAYTALAAGILLAFAAILMWVKKRGAMKGVVVLLMVLAGLGLAIGFGALENISIVHTKLGFLPLWVWIAIGLFIWFGLEVLGWGHHHTRTPLLGLLVAGVLGLVLWGPLVHHAQPVGGNQPVHTTSVTRR